MKRIAPMLALACGIAATIPARAGVPSPSTSYVDPCIVICPAGDSVFTMIARYFDGRPYGFGTATVHLCDCPDVVLVPAPPGSPEWIWGDCNVSRLTDGTGTAAFRFAGGGTCTGASIMMDCDGVVLATRSAVASFDQDGDQQVEDDDLFEVQTKLGTADPTADFDCDGLVTMVDQVIAAGHLGHAASVLGVGGRPDVPLAARPIPNPGRGPVEFVLLAPAGGRAVLAIFDLSGRRLARVLEGVLEPGVSRAVWSGRDDAGRAVEPGLYFYRFTVGRERVQGTVVVRR